MEELTADPFEAAAPSPQPTGLEDGSSQHSASAGRATRQQWPWWVRLSMKFSAFLFVVLVALFELLKRWYVPRKLQESNVACSRLVVRFDLLAAELRIALKDVSLTPKAKDYLELINSYVLGEYLPCKLEVFSVGEFGLTFKVWLLFRRALETQPRARAFAGRYQALKHLVAEDRNSRVLEVRLAGMVMHHSALPTKEWWGGAKALQKACIEAKQNALDAAVELITAHVAFGGTIRRKSDEKTRYIRRTLCSTRFVIDDFHITFTDPALPALFTIDIDGLSVGLDDFEHSSETVEEDQVPAKKLLGTVPEIIHVEIATAKMGLEPLRSRREPPSRSDFDKYEREATLPPMLEWKRPGPDEVCFSVTYIKRKRPDEIGKKDINIRCSSAAELRLLPMHLELFNNRLIGLYYSFSGWQSYVQQRVHSGIMQPEKKKGVHFPDGGASAAYDGCNSSLLHSLARRWRGVSAGSAEDTDGWESQVASLPLDVLLYSRLLAETAFSSPLSKGETKRTSQPSRRLFGKIGVAVQATVRRKL